MISTTNCLVRKEQLFLFCVDKMAEETTSVMRTKTAVNQSESSALFLLQSISEIWRINQAYHDNPGLLMRNCLLQAGVSFLGQEALQVHMALFRNVFFENEGALTGTTDLGFSVKDYFELLRDEKLGWLPFLTKLLPCLRLKKANMFLEELTQFLKTKEDTLKTVQDIHLLLSAVSLVHGIVTDFLLADNRGGLKENATGSLAFDKSSTLYGSLSTDAQTLAAHLMTSLASILQLCKADHLLVLIHHDADLFRQLVESLILSIAVLNPFSSTQDTASLLLSCHIGHIVTPSTHERDSQCAKSKLNTKMWKNGSDNFVWTEVALEEAEDKMKHLDQETSNESAPEVDVVPESDIKFCSFNVLMNSIISVTPIPLFTDLVCWFCKGEINCNKDFYKPLANVLFEGKDIHAGRHVLSGQIMYSWFTQFLQSLTTGSLALSKTVNNSSELLAVFTEVLQTCTNFDLSCLNKTEIDEILETGREIAGQEDLDLVKRAVINQKSGWKELLELGLRNRDIIGWWRAGFFELVRDKEATLSTERNVRHVLKIMSQVAGECQISGDAEFQVSINQLFGVMFKRLPTLLQEQVVLSTCIPPCHEGQNRDLGTGDLLCHLSKGEVIEQLTPVLNKLTSADVDKMMGDILLLCLFDTNVVLKQVIQVALENKAQVLPIIQVLHQMPRICCSPEPKSNKSKLLFCLREILSGIKITGNMADNVVQILCLFTETYTQKIDIDHKTCITKDMPGLLSQSDIFQYFICPSINSETSAVIEPRRPGESSTKTDVLAIDNPEIHSRHARTDIDSDMVHELPLDVALRTLSSLLDKLDLLHILALKPIPLLASLANLYANNYIVFQDGQLDKKMLMIKQASKKNIVQLFAAVWKYSRVFTKSDFLWLKKYALQSGWLCTAVLKPVLNIGCDVELHDILSNFGRRLMSQEHRENNIRGLVLLIQLALVNDEMLSDVMSVVKQSQLSTGQSQLVLAVSYILTLSISAEMYRLVKVIIMILTNQKQPFPVDGSLIVSDVATEVYLLIQANQVLTDAMLQLGTSEMTADSWCHIASNYQAALQSLLQQDTPSCTVLVDLLCHCCTVLSATRGQAAQLLQVSAMDILTKLKACLSSEVKSDTSATEKGRLECEKGVSIVEDYIGCVAEGSVKKALYSQLANVLL